MAYFEKGLVARAMAEVNRAIETNPSYAEAYMLRGAIYLARGDRQRVASELAIVLLLSAEGAADYFAGRMARINKQYDEAIAKYAEAIQKNPRYADAYFHRGNAHLAKGLHDQALADYSRAIEIEPGFAGPYNNRGGLLSDRGLYDEATTDFNKALEIMPNNPGYLYNRGVLFNRMGRFDRAIADLTRAIRIASGYGDAYSARAFSYFSWSEYDKAWSDVNQAQALGSQVNSGISSSPPRRIEERKIADKEGAV